MCYLQLHADILSVFADVVQCGDGCLHMAAVFPVDEQPGTFNYLEVLMVIFTYFKPFEHQMYRKQSCIPGFLQFLPLFEGDEDLIKILSTSVQDGVLDFQQ